MNVMSSLLRSRYVLCGAGIAIAYVVFAIFQANHFVSTLLRGDQYYNYYLMYVPTLFALFCLYVARTRSFEKLGWSLVFGVVAGYVAGLAAYIVVVFSMGDGLARIANSARDLKSFLIMLSAPLLYLSWAYGALAALSIYLIKRRVAATEPA
jgi:hypothetical protein